MLRHYDEGKAEEKRDTLRKRCFPIPADEKIAVEAAKLKRSLKLSLAALEMQRSSPGQRLQKPP